MLSVLASGLLAVSHLGLRRIVGLSGHAESGPVVVHTAVHALQRRVQSSWTGANGLK